MKFYKIALHVWSLYNLKEDYAGYFNNINYAYLYFVDNFLIKDNYIEINDEEILSKKKSLNITDDVTIIIYLGDDKLLFYDEYFNEFVEIFENNITVMSVSEWIIKDILE